MKKKSTARNLILPLFVLLPILVYGFFELNSLNEDEEALEAIYQRQLDAVLFSIEQDTDGKLRTWAAELELKLELELEPGSGPSSIRLPYPSGST